MLTPCEGCRRHVRAIEETCPFCGATISKAPIARPLLEGRLSRAAVFASAVLAAPGCIVQNPPPNYQQQQYQQSPPPPPPDYQQARDPEFSQPPPRDPPTDPPPGAIRGQVFDSNGLPAARLRVDLQLGSQPYAVFTNDDGQFTLAGLPDGTYVVSTQGSGRHTVKVAGGLATIQLRVPAVPVAPPSHLAKPYGAPPARKRVV